MRLAAGDALMRFTVSAPHDERFAEFYTGEAQDASGGYRFTNDAGPEQPSFCRRVFHRDVARRVISPDRALAACQTVAADESGMVHFSCFRPIATHSQRWLRVTLTAPQRGNYPFQLATCGGIRIWVGDNAVASFTPFTRNTLHICQAGLPLDAGENRVLIHLEELCERNTQFVMRLIYQGKTPLKATLNEPDAALPLCINAADDAPRGNEGGELLALLNQRGSGPQAERLLVRVLQRISAREEASSDVLVSLLSVWRAWRGDVFPPVLWRRVRSAVLGYRYWFDEPGNDVMWFTSPHNALSFHTAQYLAGQFFSEERFTASGRTGREQQAIAAQRLAYWFASATVQEGARPCLLALSQLADDPALRARAQRLLTTHMNTCSGAA